MMSGNEMREERRSIPIERRAERPPSRCESSLGRAATFGLLAALLIGFAAGFPDSESHAQAGSTEPTARACATAAAALLFGGSSRSAVARTGETVNMAPLPDGLPNPAAARLNVLLVTVDTLRADRVGCLSNGRARTPAIDGLAARGALFERAFAHVPVTLPSHASILTGLTPPAHGVHDNGRFVVAGRFVTLAERLKDEGYATGAFVGGYPLHSRFGLAQGFDVYDDRFDAGGPGGREFAETRAETVVDRATAWLNGRAEPWFLWVHCYDPHDPYEPPEPFSNRFAESPYDGEVAYVDAALARLFESLRNASLFDRTLIVLTGDHGESLGEHGESTHGFLAYNSTLWVPLIVVLPGARSARVESPVSHADLVPTVCDALAVRPPAGLQGRSLLPAVRGRRLSGERPIYFESLAPYYGRGWAPIRGTIGGGMKFAESPLPELFDLREDFDEQRNLAGARDLRRFRRDLDRMRRALEDDAAAAESPQPGAEAVERLRSLGYAAGPAPARKSSFGPEDDVKTLLPLHERAMAALVPARQGRADEGIRRLLEIIAERPDLDSAHVNLALLYDEIGRADEAIEVLENALEAVPDSYDVLSHAVRLSTSAGRFADAVELAAAHPLPPMDQDPNIWVDLGLCHRRLGDLEKARAACEAALAIDATCPAAHNNLGMVFLAMHLTTPDEALLGRARESFTRAVALDPAHAAAHYGLGQALYRGGDPAGAVAPLRRALELEPSLADASFYLGMSLLKAGHPGEALPHLRAYRAVRGASLSAAERARLDALIRQGEGR